MIFHLVKIKFMKKLLIVIIYFTTACLTYAIPEKPVPVRYINDFANVLNKSQINHLEQKVQQFEARSSTQIVVVTVNDLEGMDANSYAFEIGDKWKIGKKGFDNGIVILFKPKTNISKGEVSIQVGYGLEPVIPDAIAKRIIENEMIPNFKKGDIYTGINKAIDVLIGLSLKEFTAKEYKSKTQKEERPGSVFGFILMVLIFLSIFGRTRRIGRSSMGRSNVPFWILLSMLGSGRGNTGGFGNFSSGGGSFGGGGFGGGSFGGGGASGSW